MKRREFLRSTVANGVALVVGACSSGTAPEVGTTPAAAEGTPGSEN